MGSQQLFGRFCRVTIFKNGEPTAYVYENLRVTFEISKTGVGYSNKASISLTNLNQKSRIKFVKGFTIKLEAGYENLNELLYFGDIIKVTTERKGTDTTTKFEVGDAERQLTSAIFDNSYPSGTQLVTIIQDLIKAMGVQQSTVIGIPDFTFGKGIAINGSVKRSLDKLLNARKLEWSIQNGSIQIMPISKHSGENAVVLSKDSGLIGVHSITKTGYEFDSLLNPKLMPGRAVKLISSTYSGFFKLNKVTFSGDTHGHNWHAKCEAVKVRELNGLRVGAGANIATVSSEE